MNEFLNELARLWWVEVGTNLTNPLSENSIVGLRKILKEEYDFDSEVIEYIVESAVKTPSNFHLGGNRESGMQVGTNDTAVSAHLHHDGEDDEDGAIEYDEPIEEEEEKDEEETSTDKERPDSGDDKEKVKKDIKQNALTSYEKEKLEELDDKLLKHKLMNPTTNNLNQVSTLLGKKKSDPKAFAIAKSWLGDQGVSDDDIEKQSDKSNDDEPNTSKSTFNSQDLDLIDGEAKKGGMNGTVKAPGTDSSTVNEVGVGYAMDCMNTDNPDGCLAKKLGESKLGKRYNKPKYRKQIMQSARMETKRANSHMEKKGMNPETTKVSHVWGAKVSQDNTVKQLDELESKGVTEVNGIPIGKYKKIISQGGGGEDPTDTLLVMVDEGQNPPKVEILHTSNKMSSEDIQANGSPNEEISQTTDMAKELVSSDEAKQKIDSLDKNTKEKIIDARLRQKEYIGAQSKKFKEHVSDDKTADRLLSRLENGVDDNPKGISTAEGKYYKKGVLSRKAVKKYMKDNDLKDPLSPDQKREVLRVYTDDISKDGAELRDADVQILSRLYKDEKYSTGRDSADEPVFSNEKMKSFYEEQTEAINENRAQLNEVEPGLGDKVFTRRMIKRLHLDVAEGHNPGGIPTENFTLNMGEYPRKDLKKGKDGSLYQKKAGKWYEVDKNGDLSKESSDFKDKDLEDTNCGVAADKETHQHCLGLKEGEKIEDGFDVKYGDIERDGESYKAIIYDRSGNVVAFQTCRSKSGPGGSVNDTIQWSGDYQRCMAKHTINTDKCG